MMGRGLYGKLTEAMIREADWVAARRTQDGSGRPTQRPDAAVIDVMGARSERAAKICFEPIVWHKFVADHELGNVPDLGDFIDVKSVSRPTQNDHALIVPAHKVKPHWAYLLVGAEEHPYYWLAGWLWGHELVAHEIRFERPAYFVSAPLLHKPYLLQRIARERGVIHGSDT